MGCWMLDVRCWLLVVGCGLLVVGWCMMVVGGVVGCANSCLLCGVCVCWFQCMLLSVVVSQLLSCWVLVLFDVCC